MHKFMDVKQSGTVKEYRRGFECLSIYLPPIPNHIMYDIFLKGLKVEIQADLSKEKVKGLLNLMDAAINLRKLFKKFGRPMNQNISRCPSNRGIVHEKDPLRSTPPNYSTVVQVVAVSRNRTQSTTKPYPPIQEWC